MSEIKLRADIAADLRLQAEALINDPAFSITQLEQILQQLQQLLQQPALEPTANYAAFLQLNLDWLQALMAKLSIQKEAIAVNMRELQLGKKATRSYGQNN